MGDKSPRSKQRDEKQKSARKATAGTAARDKQAAQGRAPVGGAKPAR